MTKEEKIQEAYGEYYQESKSFINKNGWMNSKEWLGGIGNTQIFNKLKGVELDCMDNYDPKYCYWFRPKSLKGIENNNGWVKIKSEEDLPKVWEIVLLQFEKESEGLRPIVKTGYWCGNSFTTHGGNPVLTNKVTHWTKLPQPPIY